MSPLASRAVLRHSRFALRRSGARNASTTTEAANTAKETASKVQSKASEGLTKVQSSAGNVAEKVSSKAGEAAEKVQGRAGRLIGFVSSLVPTTLYYSRVGLELGKIVVEHRKMSPPSLATFQQYFSTIVKSVRSGSAAQAVPNAQSFQPNNILGQIRNMDNAQLASAGVVAAEVIGFFTIGEIIGRFKLVGYRGGKHDEHH